MTTLLFLMYGVEVLVALLLIVVILIQRSKSGGGLGGLATTSAGVEEAFGSSAGNVLVKATVTLGLIFVLNTTGITICQGVQRHQDNEDALGGDIEQVDSAPTKDADAAPGTLPKVATPADAKDVKVATPAKDAAPKKAPAAAKKAPAVQPAVKAPVVKKAAEPKKPE